MVSLDRGFDQCGTLGSGNHYLEVQYVSGPSWQQFMDMIRADELDVMINVTPSALPSGDT